MHFHKATDMQISTIVDRKMLRIGQKEIFYQLFLEHLTI